MEYCDNCRSVLNEYAILQNTVSSLQAQLEISMTQAKLLKEENELLKKNIVPKKKKREYNKTNIELQNKESQIEKLKLIIQHKDEIIQNQVRCHYNQSHNESKVQEQIQKKKKN